MRPVIISRSAIAGVPGQVTFASNVKSLPSILEANPHCSKDVAKSGIITLPLKPLTCSPDPYLQLTSPSPNSWNPFTLATRLSILAPVPTGLKLNDQSP